jgi:hypothetical protein
MAYLDLDSYDILDLLPVRYFPDSTKSEYLYYFTTGYVGYLSECYASRFDVIDADIFETMMTDENTTAEEVEEFIKTKVPDSEEFMLAAALKYKKDFLCRYYNDMFETDKQANATTLPLWQEIVKESEEDNWEKVHELISQVEELNKKDAKAEEKLENVPEVMIPPPQVAPAVPLTQALV